MGRNVQLTREGAEVFEYCKKIFGSVEDLERSLGKISGECKGPLLLGASEPIASHFLPGILARYLAVYPLVYPNIFSATAAMLFERISRGEIEFGMFFHVPELPEKLEIFKTKEVRYHLVVRKDLRRKREILERFIGSREIDDVSTKRFPTLERLRKDYPEAKIKISSNNLTAHRGMVLEGLGVSILPDFLVGEDLRGGRLAEVYPQERFQFQMKFVKRRAGVLSSAAQELIKACVEG